MVQLDLIGKCVLGNSRRSRYLGINKFGPTDLHVLHMCDEPTCTNFNHMRLGTHQDNMHDRNIKGRVVSPFQVRTHCTQGHKYTPDTVYQRSNGKRECLICKRNGDKLRARKYRRAPFIMR